VTKPRQIEVMRLLCAIYDTRLERVSGRIAYRFFVAAEEQEEGGHHLSAKVTDWIGDRFDDVRVQTLRYRARRHVRRGTTPKTR
jgi:hypothetical protein